jgi:hypothetical protein
VNRRPPAPLHHRLRRRVERRRLAVEKVALEATWRLLPSPTREVTQQRVGVALAAFDEG